MNHQFPDPIMQCFFLPRAVLLSKGLSFSSHKMTISAFGENFIKDGIFSKDLGKAINKAFDRRQISDYYHDFIINREEAEEILEKGRDFFKSIKTFLKL